MRCGRSIAEKSRADGSKEVNRTSRHAMVLHLWTFSHLRTWWYRVWPDDLLEVYLPCNEKLLNSLNRIPFLKANQYQVQWERTERSMTPCPLCYREWSNLGCLRCANCSNLACMVCLQWRRRERSLVCEQCVRQDSTSGANEASAKPRQKKMSRRRL